MKQVIKNYTFNAAARTITLSDFNGSQPVLLERLALITDTTTNKILYNFADSTVATAAVSSNNVITLSALQGGEANTDKLRIDYDTVTGDTLYDSHIVSGTVTANQGSANGTPWNENISQVGGTAIATNSGNSSNGTIRVVMATDQPQLTNALKVDGSAVTQPVSGTVTANAGTGTMAVSMATNTPLGNVASGATDSGNPIKVGGRYNSTPPTLTDGQRGDLQLDSSGALKVASSGTQTVSGTVTANAGSGTFNIQSNASVNLSQVAGGTAINSGVTGAVAAGGDTASGAADAGNPLKIGGLAKTSLPTAVSDGQRVNALFTKTGKQVSVGAQREQLGSQQTTITSSTAETTIVTADGTYLLDLYGLVITNTSASATKVTIKDATAGTTRFVFQVPATDTRGFMLPVDSAHKQATVNNNWTATCGTSVNAVEITAMYVKNL